MDNYAVTVNSATGKATQLFEIDMKESMVPFNRMPDEMHVKREECPDLDAMAHVLQVKIDKHQTRRGSADPYRWFTKKFRLDKEFTALQKRLETERKSIQMARLIILGLPQNGQRLDRALLLYLTHPSLKPMIEAHHQSLRHHNYDIQASALAAQTERLERLQELAQQELLKPAIELTPRDLYFELFDGRELFDLARQRRQPFLKIFSGIIGNAYRHYFKDLSRIRGHRGRTSSVDLLDLSNPASWGKAA